MKADRPVLSDMLRIIVPPLGFGALYWILDSAMDAFIFHTKSFGMSMFKPDEMCLWMRVVNILIIGMFAAYAQSMLIKRKRYEKELGRLNKELEQKIAERTLTLENINKDLTTEIDERRKSEEMLRESEEKFSKIFRQAPLLITLSEIKTGQLLEVNSKFLEVSGFTREEVIGRTVLELGWNPEEQRSRLVQSLNEQGHVAGMELSLRSKGGKEITCLYSGELITVNGKQRLLSIAQDITERKKAEDAVKRSEEFIRNILDTVDESFLVIAKDLRIITANRAYCNSQGRPRDEIIGRCCYEITHNAASPCYENGEECAVHRTFKTGEPHVVVHRHKDDEGNVIYVETKAFPLKDDSGAVTSVIETLNNITEKYLLEEQRLKTQKLEAIGTLAGGIAHDFNNLLHGVFGYISMAKSYLDRNETAYDMLYQAEKALALTVSLTNQLLTFSKGGEPVKKKLSLHFVVENSVKFALSGSRAEYMLDIADDLWPIEADEGQIGQVIQNIVLNANEAMPEGGPIRVSARNVGASQKDKLLLPDEGKYVEIAVQDSGLGILKQYLPKIFDPYFTTKQKGTGLGLATSYSIVKKHGGAIYVDSELNKGSVFYIYLPAVDSEVKEEAGAKVSYAERHGKILVMDDDETLRIVAGHILKKLGHEVELTEKGEMAIEKFIKARESGKPFDIVILDLTVRGGMGGEEAIQKLLEIDPDIRAIVSSGYSDTAVVSNYVSYGFKACLVKPYEADTLRDVLNALLA